MPRQPRLDALGALHHVMGRGIEAGKIFETKNNQEDCVDRLAAKLRKRRSLLTTEEVVYRLGREIERPR